MEKRKESGKGKKWKSYLWNLSFVITKIWVGIGVDLNNTPMPLVSFWSFLLFPPLSSSFLKNIHAGIGFWSDKKEGPIQAFFIFLRVG
jgi:hypothetical protein